MVNITIDGKNLQVKEGTTIFEVAKSIYKNSYKELNEIGACRVCIVEIEGRDKFLTGCNNFVSEGMVIKTNLWKVR